MSLDMNYSVVTVGEEGRSIVECGKRDKWCWEKENKNNLKLMAMIYIYGIKYNVKRKKQVIK